MATGFSSLLEQKACQSPEQHSGDTELDELVRLLFPHFSTLTLGTSSEHNERKEVGFHNFSSHLDEALEESSRQSEARVSEFRGLLGPPEVVFDISANSGTLLVDADRLGITSHSNFSTIKANVCVYKGRWVYEVMLGSEGVMQIGWCTHACKFSQEEGVGDTKDSYAYDGNRLRKWNVRTQKYGEAWLTGDVISCAIDCDKGELTFYRNGRSMGVAFTTLQLGPGYAYFPAASMSFGESIRVNFGSTPLQYPIPGYLPLQSAPVEELAKARLLFASLEKLLPKIMHTKEGSTQSDAVVQAHDTEQKPRSSRAQCLILLGHVFEKLSPLLTNTYIVEEYLMKLLLNYVDITKDITSSLEIETILQLLWTYMEDTELRKCLESLCMSVQSSYRFSTVENRFANQCTYLSLLVCILQHEDTRKLLLKHVLFEKIKFPVFMHIKSPDDEVLKSLIPDVWWENNKLDREQLSEDSQCKEAYEKSMSELKNMLHVIDGLQCEALQCLLNLKDGQNGASSGFIFLHKFREFLKENLSAGRVHLVQQFCALPVMLSFFHRMVRIVRAMWDQHQAEMEQTGREDSKDAYVPCKSLYDNSINFFDLQRFGGLASHLNKEHRDLLQTPPDAQRPIAGAPGLQGLRSDPPMQASSAGQVDCIESALIELLDGIVLMYHLGAHKQLGKLSSLPDKMQEYIVALQDTKAKIARCPKEYAEVQEELKKAEDVFLTKTQNQARHMAWVSAVIYSKEKQSDVAWLLDVVLKTIEKASREGKAFAFVPEYYIEVAINCYGALKSYYHPTQPVSNLPDFPGMLYRFAKFLSSHFSDPRIVNVDTRDNIVQALACYVCYKDSLKAVESLPEPLCRNMIKSLLSPYENRSWAQTNWILVRLWKGDGFAFRYIHLPHLLPAKTQTQDIGQASLQEPCPSALFQKMISEQLLSTEEHEYATKFIDSVLNQLNWAFSEFVGMLQELQTIAARPERNVIDARQLKICATCFDITVSLLRVIEMCVAIAPDLFLDWKLSSAELLLSRLVQLLCQVLNRVTAKSNLFENIVHAGMPGLESVDHFPVLSACAGIFSHLIGRKIDSLKQERAILSILVEPSFQLSSMEFMLGGNDSGAVADSRRHFTFKKYKEVSPEEVSEVEHMITYLRKQQNTRKKSTQSVGDSEDVCSICYARKISCVFKPCGHMSCRQCIDHHRMRNKDCFYCKRPISEIVDTK